MPLAAPMSLQGGCLCGAVRYEIERAPLAVAHCHCSQCRKAQGGSHGTFGIIKLDEFGWLEGESELRAYRAESGFERRFCGRCGSQLTIYEPWNPSGLTLAFGTLDGDPGVRPDSHIFCDSMPAWSRIDDRLPRHAGWPEGLGPAS